MSDPQSLFDFWWTPTPDSERLQWTLTPFVGAGPLRFGMNHDEALTALDSTGSAPLESRGPALETRLRHLGLTLYFDQREALLGIVVDALKGPQVLAAGMALTGRTPSALEQWITDRDTRVPGGRPVSRTLGVVISLQRSHDLLLTRLVLLSREATRNPTHALPNEVWITR
ncbi:hypothetical protein ACGF13_30240 [Kitasatospora sp. NPDC048286]|uniref:hypothetical protein n=1 Tax=Kitasatospora sp. NPDC048286 TaxID=3364047 RepID=UPI00371CCB0C